MHCSVVFALVALAASWGVTVAEKATLTGRAYLPPQATAKQRADMAIIFHEHSGKTRHIYCLPDGTFSIYDLEEGRYLLEVALIGWEFPQYKLEVSNNFHDKTRVTPLGSRIPLEPEVILIPLGEAHYFPQKKPFNIMSLVLSPYGLMVVLAGLAFFVAPNMKIDPAEMEQIQSEMKDSPFAFLMGGGAAATGATTQQGAVTAGSTGAAGAATVTAKKASGGTKKKR